MKGDSIRNTSSFRYNAAPFLPNTKATIFFLILKLSSMAIHKMNRCYLIYRLENYYNLFIHLTVYENLLKFRMFPQ